MPKKTTSDLTMISVKLDSKLAAAIRQQAKDEDRPLINIVRKALTEYLEKNKIINKGEKDYENTI